MQLQLAFWDLKLQYGSDESVLANLLSVHKLLPAVAAATATAAERLVNLRASEARN